MKCYLHMDSNVVNISYLCLFVQCNTEDHKKKTPPSKSKLSKMPRIVSIPRNYSKLLELLLFYSPPLFLFSFSIMVVVAVVVFWWTSFNSRIFSYLFVFSNEIERYVNRKCFDVVQLFQVCSYGYRLTLTAFVWLYWCTPTHERCVVLARFCPAPAYIS